MIVHTLTREECVEILERNHLGRLGCSRYDQPYIVPVHYSFDREQQCVFGFSSIGQKVDWMRANPKVCLEVEEIADKYHWLTVVVTGRYNEIHQTPGEAAMRRRAENMFRRRPEWWFPAVAKVADREPHDVVVYRISIEAVSGRRSARVDPDQRS
jgi:nitroimidazol reductase NimA-like FMN-containing flavoprotein (pyridoxamine 5'-phosphate oxidase superfamily)